MPLDRLDSIETPEQWEKYQEICKNFNPTQGRSYPRMRAKATPSLELERQILDVMKEKKVVTCSEIAIALQKDPRTIQGKLLKLRNNKKVSRFRKRSGLPWEYEVAIQNADSTQ